MEGVLWWRKVDAATAEKAVEAVVSAAKVEFQEIVNCASYVAKNTREYWTSQVEDARKRVAQAATTHHIIYMAEQEIKLASVKAEATLAGWGQIIDAVDRPAVDRPAANDPLLTRSGKASTGL